MAGRTDKIVLVLIEKMNDIPCLPLIGLKKKTRSVTGLLVSSHISRNKRIFFFNFLKHL